MIAKSVILSYFMPITKYARKCKPHIKRNLTPIMMQMIWLLTTTLELINFCFSITFFVHFEGCHFGSKFATTFTKDEWTWKKRFREDDYMQFLMTRNKETRKCFGHVKVLNDQYEIIGWRATGFEDLKIHDNIYNKKNRGCSIYSSTQPTFPWRV